MRSDKARLSLFIAASFGVLGVHLPFWPAWLEQRGMSTLQIGTLGMAWAWTRGAASPVWAHFVDQSGHRRRWLAGFALASLLLFAPFVALDSFAALLGLTVLFCVAHAAVLPLGENLLVLQSRERGIDYGSVRLWGSVAFVLANWTAGFALDGGHAERAWVLVLACLALAALAAFRLPPDPPATPVPRVRVPMAGLLRDRRVLAALAGGGILQAGHATYYMFATLHWQAAGHSTSVIGALWSEGVIAEAFLFAGARALVERFGDRGLMLAAIAGSAVRWAVLASTTALPVLFGVQWLHALTFSAAHVAVMAFIGRAVAREQSASAQSLYGAFNIAAHALTLVAVTPLYDRAGGLAYWPMIGIAFAGGSLAMWGMRDSARAR